MENKIIQIDKAEELGNLTPQQEEAIEMIMRGKKTVEIAEALGVSRYTVARWRKEEPEFIAELQSRRAQIWDGQREQLTKMIEKALGIVTESMESADEKTRLIAAMAILRLPAVQTCLKPEKAQNLKNYFDFKQQLFKAMDETCDELGVKSY